jgi:hypothetical protein
MQMWYYANVVTWKITDAKVKFTAFRASGDDYHRIWINKQQ